MSNQKASEKLASNRVVVALIHDQVFFQPQYY